jgi:hypothetical protein
MMCSTRRRRVAWQSIGQHGKRAGRRGVDPIVVVCTGCQASAWIAGGGAECGLHSEVWRLQHKPVGHPCQKKLMDRLQQRVHQGVAVCCRSDACIIPRRACMVKRESTPSSGAGQSLSESLPVRRFLHSICSSCRLSPVDSHLSKAPSTVLYASKVSLTVKPIIISSHDS